MRRLFLFASVAACLAPLHAQEAPGNPAAPAPAEAPPEEPKKTEKEEAPSNNDKNPFRSMEPAYRNLVIEALARFQSRDFTGALKLTDRADQMQLPNVWTLNIRGAVAIERREYEEGARYCRAALEIDPNFFPAKFNLCEIPFLQGRYAEAREMWQHLLDHHPVNGLRKQEDDVQELLGYRIFLCYLLAKDKTNAKIWLDKLPTPSTTPAYFYANAVWERHEGRMEKWNEWIRHAEYVWPENQRANFIDVLIQLQWMKPPQGEAPPPDETPHPHQVSPPAAPTRP